MGKISSSIICALGIILCAVACQEEKRQDVIGNDNSIKVMLGNENGITKASSDIQTEEELLFTIPFITQQSDTLALQAFISDKADNYAPLNAATKSVTVTTENLASVYGSFTTSVFKDETIYEDGQGKTMRSLTTLYSDGEWSFVGGPYRWPEDGGDLIFCSAAPIDDARITNLSWNNGEKITFNYSNIPSGKGHDAVDQKDLIFALNAQNESDHDKYALINFSHALTEVKFIKGDIDYCTIKTVTLKNFKSTGKAEAVPSSEKPNSLTFTWKDQDALEDYAQNFGTNVDIVDEMASLDSTDDKSYTFMIMPQILDENAALNVVVTYNGGVEQTISINLGSITAEQAGSEANAAKIRNWSTYAGKVITFKINRAGLAVAVDEGEFVGNMSSVKRNVGARNTGGKVEFVRAAIVANWVDEDGNICYNCDFANDTENLKGYLQEGCNWVYNSSDNFYYYKKAIIPGAVTKGKIFTSYTAPAAPEEGLHLEMAVIVQCVEYDFSTAKSAWGNSIPEMDGIE